MLRRAIFDALEELAKDQEFGAIAAADPQGASDRLVAYLARRGVDDIDARLLAIAYVQGARHQLAWARRELVS